MLSRFKRNTILLILTVAILTSLMIIASQWQSSQPIKEIEIKGNRYIDETYIQNLIYSDILSKKPDEINFDIIKQKILKIPLFKDCKIVTSFPEKVIFFISTTQVICRAIGDDNIEHLYTEDGALIDIDKLKKDGIVIKNANIEQLPLVHFQGTLLNNQNDKNKDLVEFIKIYNKSDVKGRIKNLWKGENNIYCTLRDDKVVIFGDKANLDSKFYKLQLFMDKVLAQENLKISNIDLRWKNQIVIK